MRIVIELDIDFNDNPKDKHEAIKTTAAMAAKHLFAQATILSDAYKPRIAVHSSDFFMGKEEIDLAEDIG
jgi:hypothetical protein